LIFFLHEYFEIVIVVYNLIVYFGSHAHGDCTQNRK